MHGKFLIGLCFHRRIFLNECNKIVRQIVILDGCRRNDPPSGYFPGINDFGLDVVDLRIGFEVFLPDKALPSANDNLC